MTIDIKESKIGITITYTFEFFDRMGSKDVLWHFNKAMKTAAARISLVNYETISMLLKRQGTNMIMTIRMEKSE